MNHNRPSREVLEEAFQELEKGILPVVNSFAPESDREDILHDVLLKAVDHLSDCHVDRKTWAARITRNEIHRRSRKGRVHARAIRRISSWKTLEDTFSASTEEENRELGRQIEEASRYLTWTQWRVWTLIDVLEFDPAHVGELIGEAHGAVRTILRRARMRLRERLLDFWLQGG